jgi:hypothetical protein
MHELDTKQQLEQVVDDMALYLASENDEVVIPLIKSMRTDLKSILSRYDLGFDSAALTERLVENIVSTRHEIRLGAGIISKSSH